MLLAVLLAVLFFAGDFLAVRFFAVERFRVVAFLAPDRPEAVMPAARSSSRTRFFTESRSERVATPIVCIWFWISSRTYVASRSRLPCDHSMSSAAVLAI